MRAKFVKVINESYESTVELHKLIDMIMKNYKFSSVVNTDDDITEDIANKEYIKPIN